MKQLINIALLSTFISFSASATVIKQDTSKYFLGASLNTNYLDISQNNKSGSITLANGLDDKALSYTLQVGTNIDKNYIVSANYEVINLDNTKLKSYYLSLDYKFNHSLNPYIGLSLGVSDLTWQIDPLNTSKSKDTKASSFIYGIQAGVIYPVFKRWDLYSQLSYQKLSIDTNLEDSSTKVKISHKDKNSLGVGLRYWF